VCINKPGSKHNVRFDHTLSRADDSMPLRFRRTFKIFPGVKVNVSKGGISTTVGVKGFHLNFGKRGITRTIDFPGRGFSHTAYVKRNSPDDKDDDKEADRRKQGDEPQASGAAGAGRERSADRDEDDNEGCSWITVLLILAAIVICGVAANALGLIPSGLLSNFLQWLTQLVQNKGL